MKTLFLTPLLVSLFFTCLLSSESTTAETDYRRAIAALGLNDFVNALHYFELSITEDPDNVKYASEYRQAVIRKTGPAVSARDLDSANKDYDHEIAFFSDLLKNHPGSANLHLNYGFAYVDKIPTAGSITQVILANTAQSEFSKAIELQPAWIGYYTRGASYLFWPKVFDKASLGVADLTKALDLQRVGPQKPYYVRTYIALGDGYCKIEQVDKARQVWREGLSHFPENLQLKQRLSLQGDELSKLIENSFDPNKRVDTDLRELWSTK